MCGTEVITITQRSVVVGLSGGVDSAVAAAQLLTQGWHVIGLFMKNWDEDDGTDYCTAIQDLEDAQQVADQLGIELHTANFAAEYWDNVFAEFLKEYQQGRTPNPDVLCNREIKFKQFVDYASSLNVDCIATGHYARLDASGMLCKGRDTNKDQSYFLQAVPLDKLRRCQFPLGDLHKPQVRELAREAGFANHRKKDSTGICFIGERRFADFLTTYLPPNPGVICDPEGVTLGEHQGVHLYTLGQRQGLGIGGHSKYAQAPWYVMAKDEHTQQLKVTQRLDDLACDWLAVSDVNWLTTDGCAPALDKPLQVKVRYRQPDQSCQVSRRADGGYLVGFDVPQRAVAPGQYACFYQGDRCLGGGVIGQTGRHITSNIGQTSNRLVDPQSIGTG